LKETMSRSIRLQVCCVRIIGVQTETKTLPHPTIEAKPCIYSTVLTRPINNGAPLAT